VRIESYQVEYVQKLIEKRETFTATKSGKTFSCNQLCELGADFCPKLVYAITQEDFNKNNITSLVRKAYFNMHPLSDLY
jgi:hypothetical protein